MGLLIIGGSGAPGPIVPPALPGVGKDGIGHRWHAAYAATATNGVTVTSWPDAIATSPDNLARTVFEAGSPEPLLGYDTIAGQPVPYVRFAGIDLAGSQQLAPPRSLYVVFRTTVLLTSVLRLVGVSISRASNGRVRAVFGGGVTAIGGGASDTDGWHSVIVNADTTNATILIDGAYQAMGTYTTPVPGNQYTVHQMGDGSGGGTAVADIRDHGTWPFGLGSDDMNAVYAALKAAYPDLP